MSSFIQPFHPGAVPRIPYDPDAYRYIKAVELADGQALNREIKLAIDAFVVGCKADSIWTAIKASCILYGAKTLSGALVPLVGTAPTNVGPFVSTDYNRTLGLLGDGVNKYLNTNRANNADPQDSNHNAVWAATVGTYDGTTRVYIGSAGAVAVTGSNVLLQNTSVGVAGRSRSQTLSGTSAAPVVGLIAINRSASGSYIIRNGGTNTTISVASQAPDENNVLVFRRNDETPSPINARLAFYSVGESLDLAKLDSRVSTLIAAIGAAI